MTKKFLTGIDLSNQKAINVANGTSGSDAVNRGQLDLKANISDFGVLFRAPTVKYFGAVGNDTADDTTAVQAAIDAHLEVVFPEGIYKCGQLTLREGTRLIGEGRSDLEATPGSKIHSTVIGLSGTPNALRIPAASMAIDSGVTIENLWVDGDAVSSVDYTYAAFPSFGIRGLSQTQSLKLSHSVISGFSINIELDDARYCLLEHSVLRGAVATNLVLYGLVDQFLAQACQFVVTNESGTANAATNVHNVWVAKRNDSQYPKWVSFQDCLIDEPARNGQTIDPVSLWVDRADDFSAERIELYYPTGATGGNGYGVKIDAGARPTLRKVRVSPYTANATHVPINTIKLGSGVSRALLEQVTTDPNAAFGGGDIDDQSTGGRYIDVNGMDTFQLSNLYVQASAPVGPPSTYVWVQTGLGDDGSDMTFWVEDGS